MSSLKIRSDKINVYRQLVLSAHFTSRIGRERLRIFFSTYLEMQLRDICNHYAKSLDSQNGYYLTWNLIGGSRLEIEKKHEENLSTIAYVVYSAAQQVVSRRGLDENSCDLYKKKKSRIVFH